MGGNRNLLISDMYKVIICLLSLLMVSLHLQSARVDSLLIRYNDWDTQLINISTCSNFERLRGYNKEIIVPETRYVDSLKFLLSDLVETEDEYFPVSCKIYIFDTDTVRLKICMNRNYVIQNGKMYRNNDSIVFFVNNLMVQHSISDSKRFLPDIMGANYARGKQHLYNLLYKKLGEISISANYKGNMIMNIRCKADKKGKTTDVKISIVNPQKPSNKERSIVRKLAKFIKDNIFWEEDGERGPFDWISFPIRYSSGLSEEKYEE